MSNYVDWEKWRTNEKWVVITGKMIHLDEGQLEKALLFDDYDSASEYCDKIDDECWVFMVEEVKKE